MTTRVLTRDSRGWLALELLDAFSPSEAREREHHARMLSLLATTPDPFARSQYEPGHFTASAFVVSRADRRVLLIAHPTLGFWLQPGGHIEPEDGSPAAGALREVREETGIAARTAPALFDVDIHEIPARGTAPAHLHHDFRFLVEVDGCPVPTGEEGLDARWLTPGDAARLTTDESVRRMIRKVFGTP